MSVMSLAQAGFSMPSVHNYTSQVSIWSTNMANKYYNTTILSHLHLPVNCLFRPELYHCSHYIRPLSFCKVYTQSLQSIHSVFHTCCCQTLFIVFMYLVFNLVLVYCFFFYQLKNYGCFYHYHYDYLSILISIHQFRFVCQL